MIALKCVHIKSISQVHTYTHIQDIILSYSVYYLFIKHLKGVQIHE